ncbi:MAG TPA: SMI1/KNR4 family protein [Mucilaginibacter sp.]|nr:SMI1/KNR4 family protein [Mucilaginibacter sp.]
MTDSLIEFSKFESSFNKNQVTTRASLQDIEYLEKTLSIKIPEEFKLFLHYYGDLWTPGILNIIVDNDIDMNDVQQFWPVNEIIDDKQTGFTKLVNEDLIPFASDCMGNIYAFKTKDIKKQRSTADVFFFDHDFDEVYHVANSFTALIEEFNSLI